MATSWKCKSDDHANCKGTTVVGAPGPFGTERCKCKCHKK